MNLGNLGSLVGIEPLTLVYLACILVGISYSFLIMLFGSLGHGGDGGGGGGFHLSDLIGGGGGDGGGGVHTGAVSINFLSPLSITTFITGFGALGLIFKLALGIKPMHTIFYAAGGSLVLDVLLNYALLKMFIQSQGSSLVKKKDIIGEKAEVLTTIPVDGLGEVWYDTKSGRQSSPARSAVKEEIRQGSIVVITELVGGVAHVKKVE